MMMGSKRGGIMALKSSVCAALHYFSKGDLCFSRLLAMT